MINFKKIFTPKEKQQQKIYVGNARIVDTKTINFTINLSEIANYPNHYRSINISDANAYEIDLTAIPFKKGENKYGNTHYIIIKNK